MGFDGDYLSMMNRPVNSCVWHQPRQHHTNKQAIRKSRKLERQRRKQNRRGR